MAIYQIRKVGDPVLRTKAKEVTEVNDQVRQLIKDMFETLYDAPGAGLAAPQIGISQRIVVIDIDDNPIALINPVIVEMSGSQLGEEGCLSFPGEWYQVERAEYARVRALNEQGEEFELEGDGWLARALQHEIDHLEGILFVDRRKRVGKKD